MKTISIQQVSKGIKNENPWRDAQRDIPESSFVWNPRPYLDLFYHLVTNRAINRAIVLRPTRRRDTTRHARGGCRASLARGESVNGEVTNLALLLGLH